MKKSIFSFLAIIVLCITLGFSVNAQANDNVQITIPTFKVTLNGNVIDSVNSQYPLIIYNDITYFPMTYNDSRLLGIESSFTTESGLEIVSGTIPSSVYQPYYSNTPNNSTYNASIANFRICVNGRIIDNSIEQYPILLFRDITYFPLTWRFVVDEFGWNSSFDASNGLVVYSVKREPAYINYILSTQNISVNAGKRTSIELNFNTTGFPSSYDFNVVSGNSSIAVVDWDYSDDILPWTIYIDGISPGTTYLKVTNSFNNQYITCPITVKLEPFDYLSTYLKENGTYQSEINAYTISFSNDNGVSVYIHYDLTYSWIVFRSICTFTDGETVSTYVYVDEIGTTYPFSVNYYPKNSSYPAIEASGTINAKDFPTYDTLKIDTLNAASNMQPDGFDDLCSASVSDLLRNMDIFLEYHTKFLTMKDFGFKSYESYSITENTSIYEVKSSSYSILENFIKTKGVYNTYSNSYDYGYTTGNTKYYMHYDVNADAIILRSILSSGAITYFVIYENSEIYPFCSVLSNGTTGTIYYKLSGNLNPYESNATSLLNISESDISFGYNYNEVKTIALFSIYDILMSVEKVFISNNLGISVYDFGFKF